MDNNCFIDKETFEVYDEHPKVFICDKKIASAIANLNKLGYQTKASCAGHYEVGYQEQLDVDLSFLKEIKNDKRYIIREIKENSFDCWSEIMHTSIYVFFTEKYEFINIPEGFILEDNDYPELGITNNGICIRHSIEYYDNDNKRRSKQDIESEIDKYCNILNEWAMTLPEIKKGR